jgi:hypothetical protein
VSEKEDSEVILMSITNPWNWPKRGKQVVSKPRIIARSVKVVDRDNL